ncbi:DUF1206 domain-containing protein [Marinicrinis sediminis]|uniref:DUF1206 domain-containing protein n=1 Tax=Marinicrinis sediminis TaxID=1652465 RepID=A0ABW5RCV9_9BACL
MLLVQFGSGSVMTAGKQVVTWRQAATKPYNGGASMKEVKKWVEVCARIGYGAKGIVYAMIGIIAIMAAVGYGTDMKDTKGALAAIAAQPFGSILLTAIAIGLVGMTVWRVVQAIWDPDRVNSDGKRWLQRLGFLISGIIYLGLSFQALRMVVQASQRGESNEQGTTAKLLEQPFGAVLVGLVGVILIGFGIAQFVKSFRHSLTDEIKASVHPQKVKMITGMAKLGVAARGLVFGLMGYFLLRTAIRSNPNETKGIDEVLAKLAQQPFGTWLLIFTAAGLVAYGLYMLALGIYRKPVGSAWKS